MLRKSRDINLNNAREQDCVNLKLRFPLQLLVPPREEKNSIPPPEFRRIACDPRACPNAGGMDVFAHYINPPCNKVIRFLHFV